MDKDAEGKGGEHAPKVRFVNDSFGLVKIQIKMILEPGGGSRHLSSAGTIV